MWTLPLAFAAGIVTILSPCVLPLLPVILSSAVTGGARRPAGIIAGFVASFTIATLALATAVSRLGLPPDVQRMASAAVLAVLGITLLSSTLHARLARVTSGFVPAGGASRGGLAGGLMIGAGLGLAWTPCVGPVMASVVTLALSQRVDGGAVATTLAFALGTALPMSAILVGGRRVAQRLRWAQAHGREIQQVFGVVLVGTAAAIAWGFDRQAQAALLDAFPAWTETLARW